MATRRSRNKSGLTPEVINDLKAKNYSQAKIAKMYGVTPQYVSWIKRQYGGVIQSPRETINEMWPWNVVRPFHYSSPYARLRDHFQYMSTGVETMKTDRISLLISFYERIRRDNVVVEYDPEIPPSEGIGPGGWAFRPREKSDGDLIIRVNKHTKELSEEASQVWRFPPEIPEPPIPAP